MSFEVGQTAGGYEFLESLGDSRIGQAYKVRNTFAGRIELLRVLPRELRGDAEQTDRFIREIKVHARLTHANILAFHNAMEIDGQLVMTTELVDGVTLAERLEKGPVPIEEAIRYAVQALVALEYAHENGVVHREIAPANIRIAPNGTVKLSGFGLAKAASDPQLTQVGVVMGWLEYMSPEQIKASPLLDGRADLYSLGIILFEMVTGQVPFTGQTQVDLMMAHVSQEPPAPSSINPAIPKDLEAAILQALAKEPSQRFQNAADFRLALEGRPQSKPADVAASHAAEVPSALPPSAAPESLTAGWFTTDVSRLLAAGALTFLVAALAFFVLLRVAKL